MAEEANKRFLKIEDDETTKLFEELKKKDAEGDADAKRMLRFLNMRDLSRDPASPLHELIERLINMPEFKDFDVVEIPEIVPARESFDLFDFPPDHPARKKTDTYFVNNQYILRTHTTVMWYYYLLHSRIKEKLRGISPIGVFSHGKVYRKDEIDAHHMNVFHQVDGLYLCRLTDKSLVRSDLEAVLGNIAKAIFGQDIKYRFNNDNFPYTFSSVEMEIEKEGKWIEVLGAGLVQPSVLERLSVDPKIWGGWAFGFGLERLAIISMELPDIRLLWSQDERVLSQLKLGNKFKEVSKFPPVTRDISFIVKNDFVPNNYFDLIRDFGGDLVEKVELLDKYENAPKFGKDRVSYTYRIIYRSNERTLVSEEVDAIQKKIYEETKKQYNAETR